MNDQPGLTAREQKMLERARRGRRIPPWLMWVGLTATAVMAVSGIARIVEGGDMLRAALTVGFAGVLASVLIANEEREQWKVLVRKLDAGAELLRRLEMDGGSDEPDTEG